MGMVATGYGKIVAQPKALRKPQSDSPPTCRLESANGVFRVSQGPLGMNLQSLFPPPLYNWDPRNRPAVL